MGFFKVKSSAGETVRKSQKVQPQLAVVKPERQPAKAGPDESEFVQF
jgi:hypothetical protein